LSCLRFATLPWVPVRPPIAADFIARLCHVPLSGLLTLLVGFHFVIGCLAASTARPLLLPGPRNLSWALYRLLMLLPVQSVSMGCPCTASHCCCLHRHTLPCATFRSLHTAGGFHFV
ncbi:unnamed protein product, partial [Staurois parvus]